MLGLGILAAFVAVATADITGTNPAAGSCLCINANGVNIRNPACGTVVGSSGTGACFTYRGNKNTCALGGTTYEWFNVNYGSGAFVAGTYLNLGTASQCASVGPGTCSNAQIVSRSGWGARPPRSTSGMSTPVGYLFIHHTAGAACSSDSTCQSQMRGIQNYHMDSNGWSDIAYNWLVGGDGKVYEGRGWDRQGAHTSGYNSVAAAVCFIGTFTSGNPTAAAQQAGRDIISCGVQQGKLRSNYEMFGHRNGGCTACPGDTLYQTIQSWPNWSNRVIPKYCKRYQYGTK